jgi:pentapeptide MXKDX repeat protein
LGNECDAPGELDRDAPFSVRDEGCIVVSNQLRKRIFAMKFACRSGASIAAAAATLILAGVAVTPASYATEASVFAQEDTMGKDTTSKDTMGKDTMGKDTTSKDTMGKDTMGKDTMGKDTMGKGTMAKDSMKKDEMNK